MKNFHCDMAFDRGIQGKELDLEPAPYLIRGSSPTRISARRRSDPKMTIIRTEFAANDVN